MWTPSQIILKKKKTKEKKKHLCVGFLWSLCERFNTQLHRDLAPPVEATSRGRARSNFKSKPLKGRVLTSWLNAETELGAFSFLAKKGKEKKKAKWAERKCWEQLRNNEWADHLRAINKDVKNKDVKTCLDVGLLPLVRTTYDEKWTGKFEFSLTNRLFG